MVPPCGADILMSYGTMVLASGKRSNEEYLLRGTKSRNFPFFVAK
jgi:hypothetical protein